MTTPVKSQARIGRLLAAASAVALLSACAVTPEPFSQAEFAARAKAVLAWLLDNAKADPERVFQVRTGQAKGAAVAFTLK